MMTETERQKHRLGRKREDDVKILTEKIRLPLLLAAHLNHSPFGQGDASGTERHMS